MTQFSALQTARSVRTRRLAAAEENIEVARAARLAQIFKEICDGIISYKGNHIHPKFILLSLLEKLYHFASPETSKTKWQFKIRNLGGLLSSSFCQSKEL